MSYVIVKHVQIEGKELPVFLIDEQNEVLTFGSINDAEDYRKIFQINSDSGHRYEVKQINKN